MNKRPLVVTVVSVFFVLMGIAVLLAGLAPLLNAWSGTLTRHELEESIEVTVTGIVALASGVLMFKGRNLGRWLAILWMAGHVVLSIWNPWSQLIIHTIMLLLLLYILFRPSSSQYFARR